MAAAAAAVGAGPRYAPHDPTLPQPWRALVDGSTGYLYYWNPENNVTQYEKPVAQPSPPLPPGPPPAVVNVNPPIQQNAPPQAITEPNRNQQQVMGGMHSSHIPVGAVNNNSNGPVGTGPAQVNNTYKYAANGPNYVTPTLKPSTGMQMSAGPPSGTAVDAYRMEHEVTAVGENVPAPFMTFDQAGLPPEILRELQNAGFTSPTPIQAQSWPVALQSRDIVAIAKTGSGKTLGYLLPAFIQLRRRHNNSQMGPTVLVLAPTRELATQIQDEALKFGKSSRISCTCLYGGAPKQPQLRELERGADIVVATPGRLNDILDMKRVSLRQVSFLILDEADRMLDMGFEPQIRKIVNEIPRQRQTLMYTATWPKEVRKIAADLLMNPVQVTIGSVNELSANKNITQCVEVVPPMDKQRRLEQILRGQAPGSKIIIFCSTKRMCDQLSRGLGRQFGAAAIHGDKTQVERDWVLGQFRNGKSPVLVATDVAARGLDIKDIRVVINFDFPNGVEDYVHRIGRTGRAGATGLAHTFFSDQDAKHAPELIKVLEGANQRVPMELREMASRAGSFNKGRGGRWDYGGRGSRDAGGRGFSSGGRDTYGGGRGGFGGRFDRNERSSSFGGRGRDSGRDALDSDYHDKGWNGKYSGDRERGRDVSRRFDSRDKGRSYSRSYSRSRSRSRGRNYSRSPSRSRSRSRSRSHDRFTSYKGGAPEIVGVGISSWRSDSPPSR